MRMFEHTPLLVLALLLGACATTERGDPPVIRAFSAAPSLIELGGSSTLSWTVTDAESLTLNPGEVDVTGETSREVSPTETTTYTLTASNEQGSSEKQTTVTVSGPGALEVAITGLEATTYVSGSLTFAVAVVGGTPDSLELRRDGELFRVLSGDSFTWDTAETPDGSYSFVARARLGGEVFDSAPKEVIVDHTPPAVTLEAAPSASPLVLPGGVTLSATASDANGVIKLEFFDGATKLGEASTEPYELEVSLSEAERGVHQYSARVVDRAGNTNQTPGQTVPAYVRETVTLTSEPALDGCVEYGYDLATFQRKFTDASCTFTTSYPILHFFSFDRSAFPDGTMVEAATLRFHLSDVTAYEDAKLASVSYANADDAPPTSFTSYPYVSDEPEADVTLITAAGGYPLADRQRLEVSALVQADVEAGRSRSQFRLRSLNNGPGGLGGTLYLAEVGDDRVPTLEVQALVP